MIPEDAKSTISNNKVAVYIRVSTNEQDEKRFSPEYQEEQAKKYIAEYNENIDKQIYEDKKKTPLKLELYNDEVFREVKPASTVFANNATKTLEEKLKSRPVLQNIISLAQNKKIGHLIVLSRDRLTRDFDQFIALKYILNRNNVKIHYTRPGENIDIEDKKINRFVDNILASVAELEANIISVRVKSGSKITVKNGYWAGGRPPYGYLVERIKIPDRPRRLTKLKPSLYEKNLVINIFRLYNLGYGYRKIAELMNNMCGNTAWTKGKIESILKNETYTGYITWDRRGGRRHPGRHIETTQSNFNESLCFINKNNWDKLKKLRAYKGNLKDPKYYDTPYLLKGKLVCGSCEEKLETKNYGKNKDGNNVCVYRCKTKDNGKYELVLKKELVENIVIAELKHSLKLKNIDTTWDLYCKEKEKQLEDLCLLTNDLEERIAYLDSLLKNIELMFKDLSGRDLREYIKVDSNKETDKEELEGCIRSELAGHLIYQETLLSKVRFQYQREKEAKKEEFNHKYINSKPEFQKVLNKFALNIDKLDARRKRILIDLLVDKIIVNLLDGKPTVQIIINPSEVIR